MSKPPRPADAIKHLTAALDLSPEDPEVSSLREWLVRNRTDYARAMSASKNSRSAADGCRLLSTSLLFSRAVRFTLILRHPRGLAILRDHHITDEHLADNLEPALALYERSAAGGVERAQQNVRNISAKILGKKAKEAESKA